MTAAAAFLLGCPGKLEDPERFTGAINPADGGTQKFACDSGKDPYKDIIVQNCQAACHNAAGAPSFGKLDLTEEGLATRLVGVESASDLCAGKPLIPSDGSEGLFIEKVKADAPSCGTRMPTTARLSEEDITCLEQYAASLAEAQQ